MTEIAELPVLAGVEWPRDEEPPAVPGFVVSDFSPLVSELADRCLTERHGTAPAPAEIGGRTAVVLVTASGDAQSAAHVAEAVDTGARVGPLLFFQSVPNSIAGHVATRWGLRGPVLCISPTGQPRADGMAQARLLIEDGDADEVLVVCVEQAVEQAGNAAQGSAFLASKGDSR
ncbi:MAG TPA: beta-ketoacyl synthase chain length factor [Actinophytocola sp.]|jgi:3-oxoacyl-(acyl-carrier-protein) synthase|uniref:beta-ketoacyl synthase chain length factor n=1 Tax=Actinophytocola sp. TaxID=1872138 RepID=UPI002F93DC72